MSCAKAKYPFSASRLPRWSYLLQCSPMPCAMYTRALQKIIPLLHTIFSIAGDQANLKLAVLAAHFKMMLLNQNWDHRRVVNAPTPSRWWIKPSGLHMHTHACARARTRAHTSITHITRMMQTCTHIHTHLHTHIHAHAHTQIPGYRYSRLPFDRLYFVSLVCYRGKPEWTFFSGPNE